MKPLERIARNFLKTEDDVIVEPYGNGIIHDTYLVSPVKGQEGFILQGLNKHVFKKPAWVMQNIRTVCDHVHERLQLEDDLKYEQWQMLDIIPCCDGSDFYVDEKGFFWRALSLIKNATVLENVRTHEEAFEVGRALGMFHFLVHHLDPAALHDTLPGFHNIEKYLARFDEVKNKYNKPDQPDDLLFCFEFIEKRRTWAPVLENACAQKKLKHKIIHGDPKSNNVMLDIRTGKAVSMIDLDTVGTGLIIYDIADCLRSSCHRVDEKKGDPAIVIFDTAFCRELLTGYLTEFPFLTATEFEYLYDAIRLIAYELGVRFVTDFLESDVYFKTEYKRHNLDRAMEQFRLTASIESRETLLRNIINDCRTNRTAGYPLNQ
jgi:Ser/Thr protein kinase RdoA (MazF antagonist)